MANTTRFIIVALAVSLAVWVIFWLLCVTFIPDSAKRGQFGDTFGAINAFFTVLAFAALIYTTSMQREELSLQRQELIETRRELSRSADAQQQSQESLQRQLQVVLDSTIAHATDALLRTRYEILQQMIEAQKNPTESMKMLQPHWEMMMVRHAEMVGEHMQTLEEIVVRLKAAASTGTGESTKGESDTQE